MARREMLAAGFSLGAWTGVIGGGRIAPEDLSADTRIGAPGSQGGRETSVAGASTKGGILAYDIARHPDGFDLDYATAEIVAAFGATSGI